MMMDKLSKNTNLHLSLVAACALAAALLWLPFGLQLCGLIEEWDVLGLFVEHGRFFLAMEGTPMAAHSMRPLTIFPHAVAHALNPDSFFFWHVLLFIAVFLKGYAFATMIARTTANIWLGAFSGVLLIFYPADTMQLSFRALHINWSLALALCGTALWLSATVSFGARKMLLSLAGSALFATACLMYESALFLFPLPVLLIATQEGPKTALNKLRKDVFSTIPWVITALLVLANMVWHSFHASSYQSSVVGNFGIAAARAISRVRDLLKVGLFRALIDGWHDALQMTFVNDPFWVLLAMTGCGFAIACWRMRAASGKAALSPRFLLVAGLIMTALGFVPYLSSPPHIVITQRTYLTASAGGVCVWLAILLWISNRAPRSGAAIGTILLLLGYSSQLNQHAHYVENSNRQKKYLSAILRAAPTVAQGRTLLIIDESGNLSDTWMLRNPMLMHALIYFYGKRVPVEVCLEPGGLWSSFTGTPKGGMGSCIETAETWTIGEGTALKKNMRKSDLVIVRIAKDGSTKAGDISAMEDGTRRRFVNVFGCAPEVSCLRKSVLPRNGASARWDFGRWWSIDDPAPGAGWRGIEWSPNFFNPISLNWKNERLSSLRLELEPIVADYYVRGRTLYWTFEGAKENVFVSVNGKRSKALWSNPTTFEAKIPADALVNGGNDILIDSPVDPKTGLSLAFDWLEIAPNH